MDQQERYQTAKRITLMGAIVNIILGAGKLLGGFFLHSHALIADGVHSFSDLFTDAMVLIASKYGSQDADDSHPYGHQRIETAATLGLAMLLILAGAGIAWDSLDEILNKTMDIPSRWTLPIAMISMLANEILFRYTLTVGNQINSALIIANAWHHRSDAASSLVVLIGLIGSIGGFKLFDPLAAIVIGAMIIKMGIEYGWNSVRELVDTGIAPKKIADIEHLIRKVNGVEKIHQLRNRMMGGDIYIDVHILVSPHLSVSEGHYIAQQVHQTLINQIDQVKDVTVHVDPEDDEYGCPSQYLPNRKKLEKKLLHKWQQDFPGVQSWILHYLNGKLIIDLILEQSFSQLPALEKCIEQDLKKRSDIQNVRIMSIKNIISKNK